jgi:hypothetical protein
MLLSSCFMFVSVCLKNIYQFLVTQIIYNIPVQQKYIMLYLIRNTWGGHVDQMLVTGEIVRFLLAHSSGKTCSRTT